MLLVKKHRGSGRPASWRCDKVTITKDEASRLVSELRDQVVAAERRAARQVRGAGESGERLRQRPPRPGLGHFGKER